MTRMTIGAVAAALLAGAAAGGDVEASRAWARATPPGAETAAMYLALRAGGTADRLLSVEAEVASMGMLHESEDQGGVSRMRDLDGIDLPADAVVTLRPGGVHVMLMDLAHPLVAGSHFRATLNFAHAPSRIVDVSVAPLGAVGPP